MRLAGPNARIQKHCRHVKLALQLAFNRANAQVRMQCFQVRDQDNSIALAFKLTQDSFQLRLQRSPCQGIGK